MALTTVHLRHSCSMNTAPWLSRAPSSTRTPRLIVRVKEGWITYTCIGCGTLTEHQHVESIPQRSLNIQCEIEEERLNRIHWNGGYRESYQHSMISVALVVVRSITIDGVGGSCYANIDQVQNCHMQRAVKGRMVPWTWCYLLYILVMSPCPTPVKRRLYLR